jgi:hypothetical protein
MTDRRLVSLAAALVKSPEMILADLNPGEYDRSELVGQLVTAAAYGSTLILFSQKQVGFGAECRLQGGLRVPQSVK